MPKRLLATGAAIALAVAIVAGTATATATRAPTSAKILIHHQMRGCHSWSVNGNAFNPTQSLSLARGGAITFTNLDVMSHTLIQKRGPVARFVGNAAMAHMGAKLKVVFTKPGVYSFTTKAGEDYMKGIKTVGEDNVLRLTVTVVA